jgi:hypothetical protein
MEPERLCVLLFPNADTEARAMMMSLIPFLRHHCHETITKWFSQTAQSRAAGAAWDPEKGCVKTFDAVSWMMTENDFSSLDAPLINTSAVAARPDASNLEIAGTGLIEDQDSVGTFDPKAPAPTPPAAPPAQLVSGVEAKANPVPLPNALSTQSVGSSSSPSSMTNSIFSRLSEIETTLKKVDNPDALVQQIAAKMGLVIAPVPTVPSALAIPPAILPAAPIDSLHHVSESLSSSTVTPS